MLVTQIARSIEYGCCGTKNADNADEIIDSIKNTISDLLSINIYLTYLNKG